MSIKTITSLKDINRTDITLVSLSNNLEFNIVLTTEDKDITCIEYTCTFNPMENSIEYIVDTVPGIRRNKLDKTSYKFTPTKDDLDKIFSSIEYNKKRVLLWIEYYMSCRSVIYYHEEYKDYILKLSEILVRDGSWIC